MQTVQRRDRVVPVRTRAASETVILNNEFSVDAVERGKRNSPLNHFDSEKEIYALAKGIAFLRLIV